MTRPNAFGVIERVLDLNDKFIEAQSELFSKREIISTLQERVRKLEMEIKGFEDVLQQSIHEKFQLEEKHKAQLARIHESHPEVVVE